MAEGWTSISITYAQREELRREMALMTLEGEMPERSYWRVVESLLADRRAKREQVAK